MSAESLQKLQQLAPRGPWTIRPGHGWPVYWHIDAPGTQSIACARDEATAALIATVVNAVREGGQTGGPNG